MYSAFIDVMKATRVEDLLFYQKALAAANKVAQILKRPCFDKDLRLRDQLFASTDAVISLAAEGFGQSTDRQFAQCLYKSRSEAKETRAHLLIARGRDYISDAESGELCGYYNEIEAMETGFIRHLQRDDRKFRG